MRVNLNDEQKKMTIKEKEKNVRNLIIMNKRTSFLFLTDLFS